MTVVGDVFPVEHRGKIIAELLLDPLWYAIRVAPQKEMASIAWLARNGVDDAWYPKEKRWKDTPGRKRKVPYFVPYAPGYLFVRFESRPVWHTIFERSNGKIIGVVVVGSEPRPITEEEIMNIKHLPKRIEQIRQRAIEERRIHKGDRADVLSGTFEGWTGVVQRIQGNIAYFLNPLMGGGEMKVALHNLKKVQT